MYCPQCGAENPDGSKFCRSCGAALQRAQLVTPAPEQPAKPRRRRVWPVILVAVAVVVVACAVVLLRVVGVSVDGGPSTKGGVATMGGTTIGPLTFGATTMGNYPDAYLSVSDGTYDFFTSEAGICRARYDGSEIETIASFDYQNGNGIAAMENLDGETLFYVHGGNEVLSVGKDGSNAYDIWSIASSYSKAEDDSYPAIERMNIYDHVIYLAVAKDAQSSGYDIWTMDEDGSNAVLRCTYGSGDVFVSIPLMTKDCVYYTQLQRTDSGIASGFEVCRQGIADGGIHRIGQSISGAALNPPDLFDGHLYLAVSHDENDQILQLDPNGSGSQVLYQEGDRSASLYIEAVAEGELYLLRQTIDGDGNDYSFLAVSTDTGRVRTIAVDESGDYQVISRSGNHLLSYVLALSSGQSITSVSSYDFDGNKTCDYITSN